MFTCRDSINLLLDFLDGNMPEEEARRLEEHLSGCTPCEDFLRTYRDTPGLCRRALTRKMPREVAAKVHDYLRYGVALVWVVDPAARTITVHSAATPITLTNDQVLDGDTCLLGFQIPVSSVFPKI